MYRAIHGSLWTDPDARRLSTDARYLFLYLLTNPHSHVCGFYYLPAVSIPHETGLPPKRVSAAFDELRMGYPGKFMADYDEAAEIVLVRRMFRYQSGAGKGEKLIIAAGRQLEQFGHSRLAERFAVEYPRVASSVNYTPSHTPCHTPSKGYPSDQYQEQDKEQEKRPSRPDRLNGNRKECEELAALQAQLRADIHGLRPLKVDDDMLAAIAKCLEASSFDDCRFVLQSYHDQAKANPEQAKWFNGETNWRLSNFKRTLGQPLPNGGQPHADPVKPVAPRCRQCGGPDPQRSGTYEGVCFSCAFPMSRTSTDRDVHPPRTDHGGSLAQALGALGRPNGNGGGS